MNSNGKTLLGKLPPEVLSESVLRYRGKKREEVLVGSALGEDAALISWKGSPFLVAASDPVVGAVEGAGRLLVHVNANDIACKGADPAWFIVTLIVPASEGVERVESVMKEIHETALKLGIAIVGGHTELTDRYERPVLCGTMMGPAQCSLKVDNIVLGDQILVTGHVGLEGMSILAHDRPDLLACLNETEMKEVRSWSQDLSVVKPARILRSYSRYMHDPTEGGLEGSLFEIRKACGYGITLNLDEIPISPLTQRVASALGFDPMHLISSGMLIAVLPQEKTIEAQRELREEGIPSKIIGHFTESHGFCKMDAHEELWGILARKKV